MRSPLTVETYVDAAGEHRWRAVARNGRIVADSGEGYKSRTKLRHALRLIARNWQAFENPVERAAEEEARREA